MYQLVIIFASFTEAHSQCLKASFTCRSNVYCLCNWEWELSSITLARRPNCNVQICKVITPGSIVEAINAISQMKVYDKTCVRKFAASKKDNSGRFIPQSERVSYSYLRGTVLVLSQFQTARNLGDAFMQTVRRQEWLELAHSIIHFSQILILYQTEDPTFDFQGIQSKVNFLAKKMSKYFQNPRTFGGGGSKSRLVSDNQIWVKLVRS